MNAQNFNPPVAQDMAPATAAIPMNAFSQPVNQIAPVAETYAAVMASQAEANVKARYAMALSRPRDLDVVRQRMLKDAMRPSFANCAIYHKPIGKGVEGPSIRFVEAALRAMGNTYIETAVTFDDLEKRIVRVSVTDLETNTYYNQDVTVQKTVERTSLKPGEKAISQRMNSYGKITYTVPATDDDILNKTNALISKAVRTLGLRLVPGDLVDEALWYVRETMKRQDAQDPDAAKRNIIDAFAQLGITVDALKEYLGHSLDIVAPAEIGELRKIFSTLRDGETTWKAIMDQRNEEIVARAKEKAEAEKAAKATKPKAEAEPAKATAEKAPAENATEEKAAK